LRGVGARGAGEAVGADRGEEAVEGVAQGLDGGLAVVAPTGVASAVVRTPQALVAITALTAYVVALAANTASTAAGETWTRGGTGGAVAAVGTVGPVEKISGHVNQLLRPPVP